MQSLSSKAIEAVISFGLKPCKNQFAPKYQKAAGMKRRLYKNVDSFGCYVSNTKAGGESYTWVQLYGNSSTTTVSTTTNYFCHQLDFQWGC